MTAARTWVIVPAAGQGARMAADRPKQYLCINGMTVLERTLLRLLEAADPIALVVALDARDSRFTDLAVAKHPRVKSVVGGASRAASVWAAMQSIAAQARSDAVVLVHDAARPLVAAQDVAAVLACLRSNPQTAAVLAAPVADTLKQGTEDKAGPRVQQTLNRDGVWAAQTPQGARFGALYQVLAQADCTQITDESMALEAAAVPVQLVPATAPNFKLTRPLDLALARAWLRTPADEDKGC